MRLYAHKEVKKNVLQYLASYLVETRQVHYLWAPKHNTKQDQDLFQIDQNTIYYVEQQQKNVKEKTLFGAFPITIDKTEYIKEETACYQVPPQCRQEILRQKIYKPSPTSLVEWVLVYEGERLRENYFYLPPGTDIHAPEIKADLLWGLHAPATQAPATQAPATQASATQAPATQASATQAP